MGCREVSVQLGCHGSMFVGDQFLNHYPVMWQSHEVHKQSMYFKVVRIQ